MAGGIEGAGNHEGENTTPKNIANFPKNEQVLMRAILNGREERAEMAGDGNPDDVLKKAYGKNIPELEGEGDLTDMKAMMLANKIQSGEVALGELTPDDKNKIIAFIVNNPDSISSKGLAIALKNKLSS